MPAGSLSPGDGVRERGKTTASCLLQICGLYWIFEGEEDLKITHHAFLAYLVPTEMWFIVSQAVPARVGDRHKGIGWW